LARGSEPHSALRGAERLSRACSVGAVAGAATRILTERDLNRAPLARQLLLESARTPLPRALERIGGLQAQYAPSMFIGLWSRLRGFERDDLTRALERPTVVQGASVTASIRDRQTGGDPD
jgi:Winged helix DNA-binding domain